MATTTIEWATHVWNPIAGCAQVSAGCRNCYAQRTAARLEAFGQAVYRGLTQPSRRGPVWVGTVRRASDTAMARPYSIPGRARIFTNSMSDLFAEGLPDAVRDEVFAVMREVDRHVYMALTKRPEVAARYFAARPHLHHLHNVWVGVSVEDSRVVHRIADLRALPVATRFLSVEPLLGPLGRVNLAGVDWCITGGESGPRARPCSPDWVRAIRDQCIGEGVAFFHKQWGRPGNNPLVIEQGHQPAEVKILDPHGKGGALVDGRLWREFPPAR